MDRDLADELRLSAGLDQLVAGLRDAETRLLEIAAEGPAPEDADLCRRAAFYAALHVGGQLETGAGDE